VWIPSLIVHKVRKRLVVRKILIFEGETKSFHFARRKLLQIGGAAVRLTP